MPDTTIRNMATGRAMNPKVDLNLNERRSKLRKSVLRSDIKTARELNRANLETKGKEPPQKLGIKATKLIREFSAGKIDMKI